MLVSGAVLALWALGACGRKEPRADRPTTSPGPTPALPGAEKPNPKAAAAEENIRWDFPARPGPAVLLRAKRGRTAVYEAKLSRQQEGKSKFIETAHYYLNCRNTGKTAEGFDRLALVRAYLNRTFKEILENGKVNDRILDLANEYVNLGPNFEMFAGQRCYAFDAQNRLAFRSDEEVVLKEGGVLRGTVARRDESALTILTADGARTVSRAEVAETRLVPQPHLLQYDTPHYLFPIFSTRPVAPGDTWVFRVPVMIPLPQAGGQVLLPTQFEVRMTGRLREVRATTAGQSAVVDYRYSGQFDTSQPPHQERFTPEFRERNRLVHAINGSGWVEVQVEDGRLVAKEEAFTVGLSAESTLVGVAHQAPKTDRSRAEVSSRFALRWLPPGTRLNNGEEVPPEE